MDRDAFWALIETARGVGTDDGSHVASLADQLARRGEAEARGFAEIRAELMAESYSYPLWGAAFIINGGCSEDCFDYFRGWLLLQGRRTWERALADPQTLVDVPVGEVECEDMLNLGPIVPEKQPAEPVGEEWDEDDLADLFPKLWKRYGDGRDAGPGSAESAVVPTDYETMAKGFRDLVGADYNEAVESFAFVRENSRHTVVPLIAADNLAWSRLLWDRPGDPEAALAIAEDAAERMLKLGADGSRYMDSVSATRAFALIANGRDQEGVALIEPLVGRSPNSRTRRQCVLAIGLAHLGQLDRAERLVAEVAAADPACRLLPRARQALGRPSP